MEPYIISALSALLGALIPTVANVVIQLQQPRMNRKEALFKVQRDVHDDYVDAIQSMMNAVHGDVKQQKSATEGLIRATNKAALYMDNTTAQMMIDYLDRVFSGRLTESGGHAKFQNDIFSSMRKNMGLKGIQGFKIIGNHLPNG